MNTTWRFVAIRFVGWVIRCLWKDQFFFVKHISIGGQCYFEISSDLTFHNSDLMIIVSIYIVFTCFYMFLPLVSHLFSFRDLLVVPAPFGFISLEGTGCGWRRRAGEAQSGWFRRWGSRSGGWPQFLGDSKNKHFEGNPQQDGSLEFLILRLRWGIFIISILPWFAERNHTLWQSNHVCWVILLVFVSANLYRIAEWFFKQLSTHVSTISCERTRFDLNRAEQFWCHVSKRARKVKTTMIFERHCQDFIVFLNTSIKARAQSQYCDHAVSTASRKALTQ